MSLARRVTNTREHDPAMASIGTILTMELDSHHEK